MEIVICVGLALGIHKSRVMVTRYLQVRAGLDGLRNLADWTSQVGWRLASIIIEFAVGLTWFGMLSTKTRSRNEAHPDFEFV